MAQRTRRVAGDWFGSLVSVGGSMKKFSRMKYTGFGAGPFAGKRCNCEVLILNPHTVDGYFQIRAVFAHNALAVPDVAHRRDLSPAERQKHEANT